MGAFEGHYKGGVMANETLAEQAWEDAARRGDGTSAYVLLLLRTNRENFNASDLAILCDIVLSSADADDEKKSFTHYLRYRFGIGTAVDPLEAGRMLARSAEQGNVNAIMKMAAAYSRNLPDEGRMPNVTYINEVNGTLVKDDLKSFRYYRIAADAGVLTAQFNVAAH